ncbi:hypothetical protein GQ43DRAFT_487291 [Delitschia confertaspora ATCC 74209]|uniref:Uncharacterized protein n=1 Tax=Delitschia confertaspora ATCC 74209 TaxID=1513339 RepID=A0A9P4JND1_9PLEO|nr:hypothetical protein GQ43DRAFT_487291 [Delitschia confertaspora ATCC 74209]
MKVLGEIQFPQIYFASKVLLKRVAGVGLDFAWQYTSQSPKVAFQEQGREILRLLQTIKVTFRIRNCSYIVADPDFADNWELERVAIFSDEDKDPCISFMHNNFSLSNCIMDNNKIVELVDWEMAGFFG